MPTFPFTEVKALSRWTNYSGTIAPREVPLYCTVDPPLAMGEDARGKLQRGAESLRAILGHCFSDPDSTLTAIGSRWSFSRLIEPGNLIVDAANMNRINAVKAEWLTPSYRAARGALWPMYIQGGTHVQSINRRLLELGRALRTSGAGDGHRLAGCLATGTHGSAIDVGAVHDTVVGMHLLVSPDKAVFVQRREPACGPEVTAWLQRQTNMSVEDIHDDSVFAAAQVALGSLGFVFGVVMETEPLYALRGRVLNRELRDPEVWHAMQTMDTSRLHADIQERPFHFEVVLNPYADAGRAGAFVTLYWKCGAEEAALGSPLPQKPDIPSDLMGLVAAVADHVDGPLPSAVLRLVLADQVERRYRPGDRRARVPGMIFGPTSLPPGHGASTEVAVSQADTRRALDLLLRILTEQGAHGQHLLGAIGTRFVPGGGTLLGMNQHAMNTFIELPSIRNDEVLALYRLFWDGLAEEGVPFTCHWGQLHGLNPMRLRNYFGAQVDTWKAARRRLLDDNGQRVFSRPILAEVGLDA